MKLKIYPLAALRCVYCLFLSLLCLPLIAQPVLKVGVAIPGQVAFLYKNNQGRVTGIYADTLRLIAQDIKQTLEFVPLSQARLNRLFVTGEIDLEIGVSARTKQSAALQLASVFSRPFGMVNEVIIYNPGLTFPAFILKDLKGVRVATVRGFSAPSYIIRDDFTSPLQIAKRVNRGWSQVGLMREAPALHYKKSRAMKYKISLPYESHPVSLRLHTKNTKLLGDINKTIDRYEQEGVLEEIIYKCLCGN